MQIQENNYMPIEEKTLGIAFEETNTNANIVLDKTNLSTILTNEDVEIKIELDNNRQNSDFYENPVFMLELPEYIEDINIKEASVLYDENLKIQSIDKAYQDGKTFLQIRLEGKQDSFSTGSFTNGTNIVLKTDIKAKLLTPSIQDHINLYYMNPNAISYTNNVLIGEQILGQASEDITYSTPNEMIAVNSISNYESTGKTLTSVKQGVQTDKISIYDSAKTAKMQLKIVNNTGNSCSNIVAIGRIPFKGNKNINSGADLGTTKDTILKSGLVANGIDPNNVNIYYSENGEATTDLNDVQNAWTLQPQDLSKVKSYLIVLNNYEMPNASTIDFSYDFEIPANLEHGNSFYGMFQTSFTNNLMSGGQVETKTADIVGLTTGTGPKIDAMQTIGATNGVVKEGEVVKVIAVIANAGSETLENVVLREYIPQYAKYTKFQEGTGGEGGTPSKYVYPQTSIEPETNREYVDINVGKIDVNGMKYVDFELLINKVPEDGTQHLLNNMSIYATGLENPLTLSDNETIIKKSNFEIRENSSVDSSNPLTEGDEITYTVDIKNNSGSTMTGVTASKVVPTILNVKEAYLQEYNSTTKKWENIGAGDYNSDFCILSFDIGEMPNLKKLRLSVVGTFGELPSGKYEQKIETSTLVFADNVEEQSSVPVTNTVAIPYLKASIKNDASKEYIAEGDRIEYTISVMNIGKLAATNVDFEDVLPKELNFVKGNYIASSTKTVGAIHEYDNKAVFNTNIMPGENININITAEARNLPNDEDEVTITNFATFDGENVPLLTTDSLTTRIEQNPNIENPKDTPTGNGNNSNNGTTNSTNGTNSNTNGSTDGTEKTYRIRGVAWVDADANGARGDGEQVLSGLRVMLANPITGQIVKDKDTGAEKITTTSGDGSYVFENLQSGDYIVIFYYDNALYGVTDYRKAGVDEARNSDVISQKVSFNGDERVAAITDTIKLSTSSYANLDMGLVTNKKFDLKLDKVVTKITVQNKEGVKSYNYSDTKLAKVDVTGKQLANSTIVTEYKIKVTNEGNVAGYAKNIVDYLPKQMKFNSNLNPNWYAGNDGNLYNTSLANQVIRPGETKEVKLLLTKQMVDSSSVIVNNLAEVYDDYNDLGISDVDSKTKNKAQNEDDLGSADLIITIKTGSAVTYTCSILIILLVTAAGIYVLRKRNARYYN